MIAFAIAVALSVDPQPPIAINCVDKGALFGTVSLCQSAPPPAKGDGAKLVRDIIARLFRTVTALLPGLCPVSRGGLLKQIR